MLALSLVAPLTQRNLSQYRLLAGGWERLGAKSQAGPERAALSKEGVQKLPGAVVTRAFPAEREGSSPGRGLHRFHCHLLTRGIQEGGRVLFSCFLY